MTELEKKFNELFDYYYTNIYKYYIRYIQYKGLKSLNSDIDALKELEMYQNMNNTFVNTLLYFNSNDDVSNLMVNIKDACERKYMHLGGIKYEY